MKTPYKTTEVGGRSRTVDYATWRDIQGHPDPRLFRTCVHLKTMAENCSECEGSGK